MVNYSDYLEIGPGPADEDCAQVGDPDYAQKARTECRRFIDLIRKKLGPEPAGAMLTTRWNDHDFGSYLEVVCKYDRYLDAAIDYAFRCEAEAPTRWEEQC